MLNTSPTPILIQTSQPNIDVLVYISLPEPLKHPDVIWINPLNEPITIDIVRQVQQEVLTKPYQAETRFFILQAIHLATIEAQQALLKILEEPPRHITLILTTEYPGMIISTILSRVELKPKALELNENESEILQEVSTQSIGQKLQWASTLAGKDNPTDEVLSMLAQQIKKIENNPTLIHTHQARTLEKTLELLRAKTNAKLSLEWLALHI